MKTRILFQIYVHYVHFILKQFYHQMPLFHLVVVVSVQRLLNGDIIAGKIERATERTNRMEVLKKHSMERGKVYQLGRIKNHG